MIHWRLLILVTVPVAAALQPAGSVHLGTDLADGFYGPEPPFDIDRAPWLGLSSADDGYVIAPTRLEWRRLETSPGADGPTFALSSSLPDPLVLFSEVGGIREGRVRGAEPRMVRLSSGSPTADMTLGPVTYRLGLDSAYPDRCEASVTLSDGERSQAIAVEGVLGCGDPHFSIHWAGDLDRDGRLDLVATFSMKYSYHPRQLYLSSLAAPGAIVGLAAMTERTAG